MARTGRQLHLYINASTDMRLIDLVSKSAKKEITSVIEDLINTSVIIEAPPVEYFAILKELHYIGHNLNQIATKANSSGDINAAEYKHQAALLRDAILKIRRAVEAPEKNE